MTKPPTYSPRIDGDMDQDPQGDWTHLDDLHDWIKHELEADAVADWAKRQTDEEPLLLVLDSMPIAVLQKYLIEKLTR